MLKIKIRFYVDIYTIITNGNQKIDSSDAARECACSDMMWILQKITLFCRMTSLKYETFRSQFVLAGLLNFT